MTADQLEAAAKTALALRVAELTEREQIFSNLISVAADGDQRIAAVNRSSRLVSELRSKNEQAMVRHLHRLRLEHLRLTLVEAYKGY